MNFYGCFYYDVRKNPPKTVSQIKSPSEVVESPSDVVDSPSEVVVESQIESPSEVVVESQTELPKNINLNILRIASFMDLDTQKELVENIVDHSVDMIEDVKELVEDIVDHSVDMIEDINDIKEKYEDYQKTHSNKDIVEIENDTRKIVQDGEVIYEDAKKLNWFSWLL